MTPKYQPALKAALVALTALALAAAGSAQDSAGQSQALDYFQTGGLNETTRATLATVEILSGYSNWFDTNKCVLGYKLTGSVAVGSPSVSDYVTSQLLGKDNGLMNFYASVGMNKDAYNAAPSHPYGTDKLYILSGKSRADELLVYVLDGAGLRGYKPGLESGNFTMEALGTCYLGLGFDGASYNTVTTRAVGGSALPGIFSVEAYVAGNVANRRELDAVYGATGVPGRFATANVSAKLSLGSYTVTAFYGSGVGSGLRQFARDMAGVSLSYAGAKKTDKNSN